MTAGLSGCERASLWCVNAGLSREPDPWGNVVSAPSNQTPPHPVFVLNHGAGVRPMYASIYVQLAADDASFATGNIYGAGGGQGQP